MFAEYQMSEEASGAAPMESAEQPIPTPTEAPREAPSPEPAERADSGEGGETEAPAEMSVEEIEFDFGGNKKKWPKGTPIDAIAAEIEAFTKGTWQDYTRKSQSVAEERKALEAERSVVQKLSTIRNEALTEYAKGLALKSEIEQLQRVDIPSLWQSDPDRARQISDVLARKQAEFQRTVHTVSEYETRAAAEEQQHVARLAEEGRQKVVRAIKGFDEGRLIEYAAKNGIPESDARQWPLNPATAVMAWKAMQFDALQAKAAPPAKAPTATPAPVRPIAGKSSAPDRDIASMSMTEYAEYMNRQERQRSRSR